MNDSKSVVFNCRLWEISRQYSGMALNIKCYVIHPPTVHVGQSGVMYVRWTVGCDVCTLDSRV